MCVSGSRVCQYCSHCFPTYWSKLSLWEQENQPLLVGALFMCCDITCTSMYVYTAAERSYQRVPSLAPSHIQRRPILQHFKISTHQRCKAGNCWKGRICVGTMATSASIFSISTCTNLYNHTVNFHWYLHCMRQKSGAEIGWPVIAIYSYKCTHSDLCGQAIKLDF